MELLKFHLCYYPMLLHFHFIFISFLFHCYLIVAFPLHISLSKKNNNRLREEGSGGGRMGLLHSEKGVFRNFWFKNHINISKKTLLTFI